MTREFWQMCRLVSQIADAEFTENIQHLTESAKDPDVRQRASLLRAYLQGVDEGEKERLRFKQLVGRLTCLLPLLRDRCALPKWTPHASA